MTILLILSIILNIGLLYALYSKNYIKVKTIETKTPYDSSSIIGRNFYTYDKRYNKIVKHKVSGLYQAKNNVYVYERLISPVIGRTIVSLLTSIVTELKYAHSRENILYLSDHFFTNERLEKINTNMEDVEGFYNIEKVFWNFEEVEEYRLEQLEKEYVNKINNK